MIFVIGWEVEGRCLDSVLGEFEGWGTVEGKRVGDLGWLIIEGRLWRCLC
jgi:hypothetical protein